MVSFSSTSPTPSDSLTEWRRWCKTLPHLPGVYRMLSEASVVLYVGKARDLQHRVTSYFTKSDHSPRISMMIKQIAKIETTVTRSEAEALLLESNLIKALAPRYNILFRDDKTYPYIKLSSHSFPQIMRYRGTRQNDGQFFGPYPSVSAVRQSIEWLQRIFRLRTCDDSVFCHRSRPCLLHQIERCTAPCVGLIDEASYHQDVEAAALFLQGKTDQVVKDVELRMQTYAADQQYEKAALCRDRIFALNKVRSQQYVIASHEQNSHVIAIVTDAQQRVVVNVVTMSAGQHLGDKSYFSSHLSEESTLAELLEAFIMQYYANWILLTETTSNYHNPNVISVQQKPDVIIVGSNDAVLIEENDWKALEITLSSVLEHKVSIVVNPKTEQRAWLDMALTNAQLALAQRGQQRYRQADRLDSLCKLLELPKELHRIECFDISHTGGEATVASCVVYDHNGLQPKEYRRFNISGITPGDDPSAIFQAVSRCYAHRASSSELELPDLVLIDGGRLQLKAANRALVEQGLDYIPCIGIAKGEGRKTGLETLFFVEDDRAPFQLSISHPALLLLAQIRDEAHRFAITGHRMQRTKRRLVSQLDEIAGIGAKRRQKLLIYFGSVRAIADASIDDLCKVEGISRRVAENIYQQLHGL